MKLTKYEHACVVIEEQGQRLVIDPGAFTQGLKDFNNVAALVITHQHPDHYEPRFVDAIVSANPDVQIFIPADMNALLKTTKHTVIHGGDVANVGPFQLQFYGEQHAEIHPEFTMPNNVGLLVNGHIYYPGDSFTIPDRERPEVLLAPVSAPWLKIGETIDFVEAIKPKICIPTHNSLLSEIANSMTEQWLKGVCERHNTTYKHLNPGDTIKI
jgi:L-ascorbate metabolism protein UlaG (beta-lactamase superfamily)